MNNEQEQAGREERREELREESFSNTTRAVFELSGLPPAGEQFTAHSGVALRKVWRAEQPIVTNEGVIGMEDR